MFLLQALDFSLGITPRLLQRLPRIVALVLVEFQLSLCHPQLILQVLLLRFGCGGDLLIQCADVVLVFLKRPLSLVLLVSQLLERRR